MGLTLRLFLGNCGNRFSNKKGIIFGIKGQMGGKHENVRNLTKFST